MNDWAAAFERVPDLLAAHVRLSFSALALGLAIALPLGVWAARRPGVARIALGFASLVQTIPSLALLALFFPVLLALSGVLPGIRPLGFLPSLLALTLYALLPVLRNAVAGLQGVDKAVIQAADGMGMTAWQKLRLVEAPLASPTIMAGIRTAAVWTMGAATLSTTVGQPSLGDLIFAGLQTQNWTLVLAGCLTAAALAILVDQLLGAVESGIARRRRARIGIALGALAMVLVAAVSAPVIAEARRDGEVIVVGAKRFGEQYVLARLIGSRLEAEGFTVRYRENLGSAVVFGALASDEVQVYVDYAGTIWTNEMDRSDMVGRQAMLAGIGRWIETRHGGRLLGPLGFENAYAFATTREIARRRGLATLDDLARAAPGMVFGTDVEFLERPEWAAVRDAYGIDFRAARSFEPTFMYRALAGGQADVISAFSSDGRIAADGLVVLADPRGAIPAYDAMLLLSPSAAGRPRIAAALAPLVGAIPVELMRQANYMVDREDDKRSPAEAAAWLEERLEERQR